MSKKGGDKPKETAEEKALAEIGLERYQDYKTRFVPVENMAIDKVLTDLNKPADVGAGWANTSTQMAFSKLEPQMTRGLTLRGAEAGSGAFTGAVTGLVRDRTKASSLSQVNAGIFKRAQDINNLESLINIGQGQANSSLSGLTDVANAANRQAIIDAQAAAAARAAVGQTVGTVAGVAYGNYANRTLTPDAVYQGVGPNINTSAPSPNSPAGY